MAEARRPGRNFLFVPGPTNIPDRVLRAMHIAMEDHRSSDFPKLTKPLYEGLKQVFKTEDGDVVILPSSGTGAWECALTNTCSPGDKMLAARFGQFSHLWIELARRHGLEVIVQEEEWGTGANPERIAEALRADKAHTIKGVMVVHNETATGVTSGVAAVRRAIDAARHPALLYVDGVSSIGSIDFRMDEWGVDLAITGSQKGLMLPAGLGIVCASQKGVAAMADAKCRRSYFDFADQMRAPATGYFPTPRPCRCSTACARLSPCCARKVSTMFLRGITGSPMAPVLRSRRGGSSSAPRNRNGIPTPLPRSWCRPDSTAPT
jgi:alanine-glyoxylate transaminase/serine-glyoxylate transaminase/serine-pyruvate transaminase